MRGGCLCGAVSFDVSGPILSPRYCHCANCRKFSGTGFAAWGLVGIDQLNVSAGSAGVTRYDSGGGSRVFCTVCGSPLWYEPKALPRHRGIPLGAIDDDGAPKPEMHVWTASKPSWVDICDGLPSHGTLP